MEKSGAMPFVFDKATPARYGVLPKRATDASDIKWFELPAHMVFHVANAWQEGSVVKLYVCCFEEVRMRRGRA